MEFVVEQVSPDTLRHQAWAEAAGQRARGERSARLRALRSREAALRNSVDRLLDERRPTFNVEHLLLRPGFYSHPDVTVAERQVDPELSPQRVGEFPEVLKAARSAAKAGRPPLARLVNRKGAALQLELAALALAQLRAGEGQRPDFRDLAVTGRHSWSGLLGDPAKHEQARRHVTDGLARLRDERLAALPPLHGRQQQRYSGWELWAEDGEQVPYLVPGSGLPVSVDFWLRGWSLVLTGPEILTYLMFRDMSLIFSTAHTQVGVGLAPAVREQVYGVTKGVYAAANELEEFGLLERTTPRQPGKVKGDKPREVDRWRVVPGALGRDAFDVVEKVLSDNPTPARMLRFDPLHSLELFLEPPTVRQQSKDGAGAAAGA